jgi:hypothetical protein
MRSEKRKRDDRSSKSSSSRRDPDQESDDSSSEEERVDVKRRKGAQYWSEADDKLMKRLRGKGERWEEITKSFPGRSVRACAKRYNSYVRRPPKNEGEKKVNGLAWSKEEELQLKKLKEDGLQWEEIAKSFPGRTRAACKMRYCSHVNEAEKIVAWTSKDDKQLKRLREKDGMPWKEIEGSFPGRTVKACQSRYANYVKKETAPRSKALPARGSNTTRNRRRSSSNNRDDDNDEDSSSSSNEDGENEEASAASEPSPASPPLEDDILPPVISSSSVALTYFPPPLPRRSQRRKFSSSGARRDEKMIGEFCCWICTRLIFRAQVMRPCGCHVFCEECVPPLNDRTSACYTCSTPFEQALPYRTGNNIAEQMVRARFVKAEVADEWRSRGAEYAREQRAERG